MLRILKIIGTVLVWAAIVAYFVAASSLSSKKKRGEVVKRIEIEVLDSNIQKVITPTMVSGWFAKEGMQLKNREIERLNTADIRRFIMRRGFVKDAIVYTSIDGTLHIKITQRYPVVRINTYNGYNFYVTNDNYILPMQSHEVIYTPVVSGAFTPPFGRDFVGDWHHGGEKVEKKSSQNYRFFDKLINFVEYVRDDDYWGSQIVQINVLDRASETGVAGRSFVYKEPEVEIVPRTGNHVVLLGELGDEQQKLNKLLLFYRGALTYEGWQQPMYINLKYKNQIVCTQ